MGGLGTYLVKEAAYSEAQAGTVLRNLGRTSATGPSPACGN